MERVGDRAENIAEYTLTLLDTKERMTPPAIAELQDISGKTMAVLRKSLDIFEHRDLTQLAELESMKKEVVRLQRDYTANHVSRLQEELCSPHTGVVFTNMLASLERIASHAINIAYSVEID
jgi:phosphate:Na+ symporter